MDTIKKHVEDYLTFPGLALVNMVDFNYATWIVIADLGQAEALMVSELL